MRASTSSMPASLSGWPPEPRSRACGPMPAVQSLFWTATNWRTRSTAAAAPTCCAGSAATTSCAATTAPTGSSAGAGTTCCSAAQTSTRSSSGLRQTPATARCATRSGISRTASTGSICEISARTSISSAARPLAARPASCGPFRPARTRWSRAILTAIERRTSKSCSRARIASAGTISCSDMGDGVAARCILGAPSFAG